MGAVDEGLELRAVGFLGGSAYRLKQRCETAAGLFKKFWGVGDGRRKSDESFGSFVEGVLVVDGSRDEGGVRNLAGDEGKGFADGIDFVGRVKDAFGEEDQRFFFFSHEADGFSNRFGSGLGVIYGVGHSPNFCE